MHVIVNGAAEWTRTTMMLPSLAPEASASADFATAAHYNKLNYKSRPRARIQIMVPRTGIEPVRLSPIPGF